MKTENASQTMMGTALMRAAHVLLDDDPRILDDSVSLRLLPLDLGSRRRHHCEARHPRYGKDETRSFDHGVPQSFRRRLLARSGGV
jgi:hypothetical protein